MKTLFTRYFYFFSALVLGIATLCAFRPLPAQRETAVASDTNLSASDRALIFQTLTHADSVKRLELGEKYYSNICASCHGDDGKGDGPTAMYLKVKPRDFTRAQYKFRSTASGQLPLDEDLFQTISGGLPTTAMPAFGQMDPQIIAGLVMYIKGLSSRFSDPSEYPLDTIKVGIPVPYTSESIRRGRIVYLRAKCWNCHGMQAKGDGPAADNQFDDKGNRLYLPDLTNPAGKKIGVTPEAVYKLYTTGLNGTTMPSYRDGFSDQERWDLANYTIALSDKRKPFDARELPPDQQ